MNIREIETASLQSWPALHEESYDGWILRFSDGYTKRANSVNTIAPSTLNLEEKIATCERFYRARDLPTIFRITPLASPKNLDATLDDMGYEKIDISLVLTLDLQNYEVGSSALGDVTYPTLDEWLEIFCDLRGDALDAHKAHRKILEACPTPKIFALLKQGDQPVTCGVGSLVDGFFGMFDLFTRPDQRGKGFGTNLVLVMLSWAIMRGAKYAYLQVVEANKIARKLYNNLGFERAYSYWYRKKVFKVEN